MLDISKIKVGMTIVFRNDPYQVIKVSFSKMGRQGAVLRTKIKNLKSGAISDYTFRDSDKIEEAELERKKAQYLYCEGDSFIFMNLDDFDQFPIDREAINNKANFLVENSEVIIIYFKEAPINIELPVKINLTVKEAPPAIRGNTADGATKKVVLETGYELSVPLFIKEGDKLRINTENGTYVERVAV